MDKIPPLAGKKKQSEVLYDIHTEFGIRVKARQFQGQTYDYKKVYFSLLSANILFCPALNQTLALFAPNGNDCSLYHGVMRQVGLHIDNCFLYCCILTLNVLTGND